MSVFEGKDAEMRCPFNTSLGLTTKDGGFMWSFEDENGIWQKVAIRNGSEVLQSFRQKLYDEALGRAVLTNNKTINKQFHGRVHINEVGTLMLRNSTVKDTGYFQCKFKGYKDRGLPRKSVVHLCVEPFQGKLCLSFVTY